MPSPRSIPLRRPRATLAVFAPALLLAIAGCDSFSLIPTKPVPVDPNMNLPDAGPFAAAHMRIYPLTHLGIQKDGTPELVLHVELTDQWRDTVKGVGILRIGVSQPGPTERPLSTSAAELHWEVDMRDPAAATNYYDRATRTFRIPLTGLPDWVTQIAERPKVGPETGARVLVSASFETTDAQGERLILRDAYEIIR